MAKMGSNEAKELFAKWADIDYDAKAEYDFYTKTAQRLSLATNRPAATVEDLNEIAIALSLDDPRVRTDRTDASDFADILELVDIYNEVITSSNKLGLMNNKKLRPQVYDCGRRLAHIAFNPTSLEGRSMSEMACDGTVRTVTTYESVKGLGFHNVVDTLLRNDIHERVREYYDKHQAAA